MTMLLQIADAACWIELKAASEFIPCGELLQPVLHKHIAACLCKPTTCSDGVCTWRIIISLRGP